MIAPVATWLAFAALLGATEEEDRLVYKIANTLGGHACQITDIFLFCRVLHRDWSPAVSILVIVNLVLVVVAPVLLVALIARVVRSSDIFVKSPSHWLLALLGLCFFLLWIWGYVLYLPKLQSFVGSFFVSVASVGMLQGFRYVVACILVPIKPVPGQRGWLGTPKRRASFAPGIDTGENSKAEVVRDEK